MAQVSDLIIADQPANWTASPLDADFSCDVFEIRTCQRTLFITTRAVASFTTLKTLQLARRFHTGPDAYEFLLRFACGLESEIKGETDVFGQVKTAYKSLQNPNRDLNLNAELADKLQSIFHQIFEDTKEIRAQFLQGIGGNNYGTLSRRLLAPVASDRVLILGAGQIAKSVAPYFTDSQLKIWNRSPERLAELMSAMAQKGHTAIQSIADDESLLQELETCSILILATPPLPEFLLHSELQLIQKIAARTHLKILHLGGQDQDVMPLMDHFTDASSFFTLSDLFGMERDQNIFREKQVQQAMDACHRRSILRGLAKSISISHGWEDLALFY